MTCSSWRLAFIEGRQRVVSSGPDAFTLSAAQMARGEQFDAGTAWRAILIASMTNLVFKAGVVAVLGGRELLRLILIFFGAAMLAGGATCGSGRNEALTLLEQISFAGEALERLSPLAPVETGFQRRRSLKNRRVTSAWSTRENPVCPSDPIAPARHL